MNNWLLMTALPSYMDGVCIHEAVNAVAHSDILMLLLLAPHTELCQSCGVILGASKDDKGKMRAAVICQATAACHLGF